MDIERLEQLLELGMEADVTAIEGGWSIRTVIPDPLLSPLVPEFVGLVVQAAILAQALKP